jgi:hypothetical protein
MTLCPIAIVAGCKQCPAFKICPLKGVIGDYKPAGNGSNDASNDTANKEKSKKTK